MNLSEKEISYTSNNTYATLNNLTEKTKHVWFVCHGMGYLSRYFSKYFEGLNSDENYIIIPQAPSKYYIGPKYKHVGGSWLTKENTIQETANIMRYFDAIFEVEQIPTKCNIIMLGYSQGVSVAMRYIAQRKFNCNHLIIHSGGIPKELKPSDFNFLNTNFKVSLIYGTQDEYLNAERINSEVEKAKNMFNETLTIIPFDGKHIFNSKLISEIIK